MESSFPDFTLPNLRHLRVAHEVNRCRSITQAAGRVHLSQPAVTQAIIKLERELGLTLFDRARTGLTTTAAGAGFLERVERALAHLANGARQALRMRTRERERGFENFDELMTATQLRTLVALSDHRNFSIAAREMGLAQPSVHRAARGLEALSGLALFRVTPIGIELSPAAQVLVRSGKLVYAEIRQGLDEVRETLGRWRSRFVLGALPLARTAIVPHAVDAMVRFAPAVQVHVVDGRYLELLRGLREGDIDCLIGALRHPPPADDVAQEPLFADPLAIVGRRDHPLAGRDRVTLKETLHFPWVAPPKTTPAGSYLFKTLRIGDLPQTPVRVVSSSLIFLRGLLQQGDYLTIISRHQIREEERQGLLVPLPVVLENSERVIGLTTRAGWRPTATQRRFLDFLRNAAAELRPGGPAIDKTNGPANL